MSRFIPGTVKQDQYKIFPTEYMPKYKCVHDMNINKMFYDCSPDYITVDKINKVLHQFLACSLYEIL